MAQMRGEGACGLSQLTLLTLNPTSSRNSKLCGTLATLLWKAALLTRIRRNFSSPGFEATLPMYLRDIGLMGSGLWCMACARRHPGRQWEARNAMGCELQHCRPRCLGLGVVRPAFLLHLHQLSP